MLKTTLDDMVKTARRGEEAANNDMFRISFMHMGKRFPNVMPCSVRGFFLHSPLKAPGEAFNPELPCLLTRDEAEMPLLPDYREDEDFGFVDQGVAFCYNEDGACAEVFEIGIKKTGCKAHAYLDDVLEVCSRLFQES